MQSLTLEQFADLPDTGSCYLIDKFIPCPGRVLLVGPPKKGKSYLALQIGLAIAQGTRFLGRPSTSGRVLYLQYDTPHSLWLDRMKDLKSAGVSLAGNFHVLAPDDTKPNLDILKEPADVAYLMEAVADIHPKLVIIDTLRKIHSGDENDSGSMNKVFDILNHIFKECAVLFVHHTHKLSPPPGMKATHRPIPSDAARGSSFTTGEVDATYLLYNNALSTDCRFDESTHYTAERDPLTKLWIFPESTRLTKLEEECRALFMTQAWASYHDFQVILTKAHPHLPDHLTSRLKRELAPTCGDVSTPTHTPV